jgi:hypothetical protein
VPSLDIARRRLGNERLIGPPLEKPEEVVSWLCAVQAQDYAGRSNAVLARALEGDRHMTRTELPVCSGAPGSASKASGSAT